MRRLPWSLFPIVFALVLAACAPGTGTPTVAPSTPTRPAATATIGIRVSTASPLPPTPWDRPPASATTATVLKVVDGDTVDVRLGGREERLRLIGIDTPETVDPRSPVQCFGREASDRAKALLPVGANVQVESHPSQGERDAYGRLLAYLWLPSGAMFNLSMIAEGFAHEYTYRVPYKYLDQFKAAERYARENNLGLWSPSTCAGDTEQPAASETPKPSLGGTATPQQPATVVASVAALTPGGVTIVSITSPVRVGGRASLTVRRYRTRPARSPTRRQRGRGAQRRASRRSRQMPTAR